MKIRDIFVELDQKLYKYNKNFCEAAVYLSGCIMIIGCVACAAVANTIINPAIAISGLTAILTWLVWSLFIFVIGVKLFPDKDKKVPFKKILVGVGYAHAPGLVRFLQSPQN